MLVDTTVGTGPSLQWIVVRMAEMDVVVRNKMSNVYSWDVLCHRMAKATQPRTPGVGLCTRGELGQLGQLGEELNPCTKSTSGRPRHDWGTALICRTE